MTDSEKKIKFFSIKDLARLFGCSRSTIYSMIQNKTIPPPRKFGRLVRWRKDDLEKWFDKRKPAEVS